ncbi:MAG: hypothetical protein KGJ57_05170 [Sphingomonadales bacterium]|nr:hypothetical protein [Sphingomonadales bacterium]MDE2168807.1 hypothetical protein [Sphingomonadales bacterium]
MHAAGPRTPPATDRPGGPGALRGEVEVNVEDDATALLPVDEDVAASLTNALRTMYDTVVDEPLPDAFAQLLNQLDDSDG